MKSLYKGYNIEVRRENCLTGYPLTYFKVFRESDGLEVICDYSDSVDKVSDMMKWMKGTVNEFIETKGESEYLEDLFKN
jgi:hypothetical protein